ncbi:hypothetical protein M514_19767 [Trichuris suis]|uniref:Uncharacterized protein n=1 Tax=Trichuris suis TaxID=68888 RepID=A0A085NF32_9BILA|nr:hypothetical protein M514_19767 [Trichuris suis]KHJ47999.1 hypothetical protein D918_01264 [Trichuris suis]
MLMGIASSALAFFPAVTGSSEMTLGGTLRRLFIWSEMPVGFDSVIKVGQSHPLRKCWDSRLSENHPYGIFSNVKTKDLFNVKVGSLGKCE